MKHLRILSFNSFTRANGTPMYAVKTDMGVTFITKEYVTKKAENIGRTVMDILANKDLFLLSAEEVVLRKAGEAYEFIDKKSGEVKSYTPENDFLDIPGFEFEMVQGGDLNRLIALNVSSQIANSISGAFSSLGQVKSQNTQSSSSTPENTEGGDDIGNGVVIPNEQTTAPQS